MIQIYGTLTVEFECARCGQLEEIQIDVDANSFDEEDMPSVDISDAFKQLEREGWEVKDGKWYCPDCIEERQKFLFEDMSEENL